jgi:integrase
MRQYRRHLYAFGSKKNLVDITRAEIKAHLKEYGDKKSAHAHSVASIRAFFNWCLRQELVSKHPLAGEKFSPIPSRTRVLSLDELRAIYSYDFPHFSTILKLAILTGQRRGEIASIQHDWIGEDSITFPGALTKNKREHTIPLTDTIRDLLDEIPFKENGTWNGWANGKRRIDRLVEIPHWQIHDIRRSFSTVMASIGVEIHVVERLLNHSTGTLTAIAQVYNKYSYLSEMKAALAKYENHIFR